MKDSENYSAINGIPHITLKVLYISFKMIPKQWGSCYRMCKFENERYPINQRFIPRSHIFNVRKSGLKLSAHKAFKPINAFCTSHDDNCISNNKFCICLRVKYHFPIFILYGNDNKIHLLPDT